MKLHRTTFFLATILLGLTGWRTYQWKATSSHRKQHGFAIVLSYPCPYPESFNILGDDRQIVVQYGPKDSLKINETPFTAKSIGTEMEKIFETRSYKLMWFIADPRVTYGQSLQAISSLHPEKTGAIIAISTPSQLTTHTADAHGIPISLCPYQK